MFVTYLLLFTVAKYRFFGIENPFFLVVFCKKTSIFWGQSFLCQIWRQKVENRKTNSKNDLRNLFSCNTFVHIIKAMI